MTVNVLGVKYRIYEKTVSEDNYLTDMDGYCDKTSKRIVIRKKDDDCQLDDFDVYRRKILRHEIIHAFLFESGLHENWKHDQWGHDETSVDWFAAQFPRLRIAFEQVGCAD